MASIKGPLNVNVQSGDTDPAFSVSLNGKTAFGVNADGTTTGGSGGSGTARLLEGAKFYVYGHSYNQNPPLAWADRLALRVGAVVQENASVAGSNVNDAAKILQAKNYNSYTQWAAGSLVTLDSTINNVAYMAQYGNTPLAADVEKYRTGLRAFLRIAQGGLPVDDTSGSYTGSWTAVTGQTGTRSGTYHSTVTQNDAVDVNVTVPPSGTVTFFLLAGDDNTGDTASAAYSIKKGATVVASGTTKNKNTGSGTTTTPSKYGQFAVTLENQRPGPTTYTLTKTDANGPLLMFDCVLPEAETYPPGILVVKDGYTPAYATALFDAINAAMDGVLAEFKTDFDGFGGSGIRVSDPTLTASWDPLHDVKEDKIHPTGSGNEKLATAAQNAYATERPWLGLCNTWEIGKYAPVPVAAEIVYTNIKVHPSDPRFLYSMDPSHELPYLSGNAEFVITGGPSWVPKTYKVETSFLDYNTNGLGGTDGTHNCWFSSTGFTGIAPAGSAGGIGYPTRGRNLP